MNVGRVRMCSVALFTALHLLHEVTSPQAFGILVEKDLPESNRKAFLLGTWDTMESLLAHCEKIERRARSLPYLNGFQPDKAVD